MKHTEYLVKSKASELKLVKENQNIPKKKPGTKLSEGIERL